MYVKCTESETPCIIFFFLYRFQESGILQYWSKHIHGDVNYKYMQKFFKRESKIKHLPQRLAFKHVSGAFFILAIGLILATIVFLLEHFSLKIKSKLSQQYYN